MAGDGQVNTGHVKRASITGILKFKNLNIENCITSSKFEKEIRLRG
jgi:hypothetical protein